MPRLFLSYRREDTGGYAGRLGDGLSARFGRSQVFRDIDAIAPGVNFVKGADEAIAACDYVLLLIGDKWLSAATKAGDRRLDDPNDFVRREIEAAIKGDVPLIPILVEGARMPTAAELPPPIASLTYFNALELADTRWDYDFNKLVSAVSKKPSARAFPEVRQRWSSWKRRPLQIAAGLCRDHVARSRLRPPRRRLSRHIRAVGADPSPAPLRVLCGFELRRRPRGTPVCRLAHAL